MSATLGSEVSGAAGAVATPWFAVGPDGRAVSSQPHLEAARRLLAEDAPAATLDGAASLENCWYAVALAEQLPADDLIATRLWGEPIVLYRDSKGEPVCVRDVCPHRSAPLSMGDVQDGKVVCFYHGWAFGEDGQCVDVPTMRSSTKRRGTFGASCSNFAVAEHEGFLWVWKGETLSADARKLPRHPRAAEQGGASLVVDTTLDYDCDWRAVAEAKLGGLADLAPDAAGGGLDALLSPAAGGDVARAVRFDAPNVIRHCGAGGLSEEFHVLPIGPGRTRVLVRQRLPRSLLLSALLQVPGADTLLSTLVRERTNDQSLREYAALRSEASGGAAEAEGGVAAEARAQFREWVQQPARQAAGSYFERWAKPAQAASIGPQLDDEAVGARGENVGTYGLKKNYIAEHPRPEYSPQAHSPPAWKFW